MRPSLWMSLTIVALALSAGAAVSACKDDPVETADTEDTEDTQDTQDTQDTDDLLPFGSSCEDDDECASGLCFPFGSDGPHCTIECEDASTCPPQNTGDDPKCSNHGVCKTGPGEPE